MTQTGQSVKAVCYTHTLTLTHCNDITEIIIGDCCFVNVVRCELAGRRLLERVVIGNMSFSKNSRSQHHHSPMSKLKSFTCSNNPILKSIFIGSRSFRDFHSCSITNNPSLTTLSVGHVATYLNGQTTSIGRSIDFSELGDPTHDNNTPHTPAKSLTLPVIRSTRDYHSHDDNTSLNKSIIECDKLVTVLSERLKEVVSQLNERERVMFDCSTFGECRLLQLLNLPTLNRIDFFGANTFGSLESIQLTDSKNDEDKVKDVKMNDGVSGDDDAMSLTHSPTTPSPTNMSEWILFGDNIFGITDSFSLHHFSLHTLVLCGENIFSRCSCVELVDLPKLETLIVVTNDAFNCAASFVMKKCQLLRCLYLEAPHSFGNVKHVEISQMPSLQDIRFVGSFMFSGCSSLLLSYMGSLEHIFFNGTAQFAFCHQLSLINLTYLIHFAVMKPYCFGCVGHRGMGSFVVKECRFLVDPYLPFLNSDSKMKRTFRNYWREGSVVDDRTCATFRGILDSVFDLYSP